MFLPQLFWTASAPFILPFLCLSAIRQISLNQLIRADCCFYEMIIGIKYSFFFQCPMRTSSCNLFTQRYKGDRTVDCQKQSTSFSRSMWRPKPHIHLASSSYNTLSIPTGIQFQNCAERPSNIDRANSTQDRSARQCRLTLSISLSR